MKRIKFITTVVLFCVTIGLTGCVQTKTSVENVLTPPKLSVQHNGIYDALKSSVGDNIILKYPKGGDYRSAFVIEDIDEEEGQEAIVFYELPIKGTTTSGTTLRVNVLDQKDGQWVSMYNFQGEGTDIDIIDFFHNEGEYYIIIGYMVAGQQDKTFKIYRYQEGIFVEDYTQNYTALKVADFNKDGTKNIFYTASNKVDKETTGNLLGISGGIFYSMGETLMKNGVTEYISLKTGVLQDGTTALYLDGFLGSSLYETEVVYYKNGTLHNPLYAAETDAEADITRRTTATSCEDINGDGILEIPVITLMTGYTKALNQETMFLTQWYQLKDDALEKVSESFNNINLGYHFIFPEAWGGRVSAYRIIDRQEIVFFEYDGALENTKKEILRIRYVKKSDYLDGELDREYIKLRQKGQLIYQAKLVNQASDDLKLTEDDVFRLFRITS